MITDKEFLLMEYGELQGRIKTTYDLAIWRDGSPVVGVMEKPYGDVVAPLLKRRENIRAHLVLSDCTINRCKGCPDCGASAVGLPEGE